MFCTSSPRRLTVCAWRFALRLALQFAWPPRVLGLACLCWASLVTLSAPSAATGQEDKIDFQRHVAPLLNKRCGKCHGAQKQESGFRVDRKRSLLGGGDLGEPAVVPGEVQKSFLLQVLGDGADIVMPPEGPRLSAAEISLLQRWIQQGAAMPDDGEVEDPTRGHWSFQKVSPPTLPSDISVASGGAIDYLIERRLSKENLELAKEADKRTLIRRLFLVMHGIPPTPERIESFINDQRPEAWSLLVEEVLGSPRYGERWARHWLDIIRFGETNGFETNRERPHAWRFRDWVIAAFNDDKPYDQFVREQLAGDVLDEPLGTGFLVAGPHDIVKSPDINLTLMQQQDELADLINATGATFLGLTVGCARCHNHKFDPITQKDYYSIQAVFAGVQHGDRALPVSQTAKRELAGLEQKIDRLKRNLAPFLQTPDLQPAVNAVRNIDRFEPVTAKRIRFTVEATNSSQPCIDELEVFSGKENVALASKGAVATSSSNLPGYEIHKLKHVNDGRYGNSRSWISNESGKGWIQIEFASAVEIDRVEWGRDREKRYADRLATQYRIETSVGDLAEGKKQSPQWRLVSSSKSRMPFGAKQITPIYRFDSKNAAQVARGRQWKKELDAALAWRKELTATPMAYVGKFAKPGPTHRLYRGDPMAKREQVGPDTVSSLGSLSLPLDAAEPERRKQFARWLSDAKNPLTARVIVNRLWQFHFGVGLVSTPSDFGANGAPPSHPELLDWLAAELIKQSWSLKAIHRQMLLSKTWRQDSRPRPRGLQVDAATRLLWRFPPRRLEAESIRDSILAVSGVLDLKMGGPGFSGFEVQLENVRHYFPKTKFGPEDWRRMIYMTKVRQEQDAVFGAFDCPDASQVMPKRSRSTTPLQALNLLNSQFLVQQSELFADRLKREAGQSPARQAARGYQLAYGRPANDAELQDATRFVEEVGLPAFCRAVLNSNELLYVP